MKLAVVVTVVMLLQASSNPSGTIEGIVVRAVTGEPISGARVQAMSPPSQPSQPPQMPPVVTTDAAGRFIVPQLEPGVYRLFVSADTYVSPEYLTEKPVNVASGQKVSGIRIPLTAAGNVGGHVRDLDGKPLAGVPVQLLKPVYNFRGERTLRSAGAGSTNDRGEYRVFWVTPGRYYVLAGSAVSIRRPPLSGAASPNEMPGQSVLPTYYPNAAELSGATSIEIQSGADLNGVDFAVERQQARRIRGRVVDATGRWPSSATIRLVTLSATGGTSGRSSPQSYNPIDGTFELQDVPPGNHEVVVEVTSPGAPAPPIPTPVIPEGAGRVGIVIGIAGGRALVTAGAQISVQVAGADVENLVLTIGAGVPINGLLVIEAASRGPATDGLRIQLVPSRRGQIVSFVQAPGPTAANENGTFTLENVVPGEYRVQVVGLQPDFYIKDARFGARDVLNAPLTLSATTSDKLEVVVSERGGRIQGTITNGDSRPALGVAAVLVPNEHRDRPDLFRNVTTDQNGRFVMNGVAPGNYKVFAWETMEPFAYYDPDFIKRYEQKGQAVNVAESSTPTVDTRLIPAGQ